MTASARSASSDTSSAHAICPHCSEDLAQLRVMIDALGRATPNDLGDDALAELVGLYQR